MGYKVSEVCGECFQFGWVEIDEKNKKVKRTLTSANAIIVELNNLEWAKHLFERKLLPRFRQISEIESAVVPAQDLSPENRGKSIDVIWIDIDYIEHLIFHPEFTANQMIFALKALLEIQMVLEQNGWYISYPHLGNMTFIPEPIMFDLGDIRRNDLCQELPDNYYSIFNTLPKESIEYIVGFDVLVKHLSDFKPGLPTDNQKFIEEALRIVNKMKAKKTENFWDNYNSGGEIPIKNNLEAFKNFQPPKSESIASVLLDLKPKTVVDVGCSEGYYSFMAESYGARSVLGIDFSEKVINFASQISISRKSVCKFAYCDLTGLTSEFTKRMHSDFAIGAAIMHHLFKAGMSFEKMANLFATLGDNCMIEYIAPFDMHRLNQGKPGHTLKNFRKAFSKYWETIELLPTIPMGSKKYDEWFKGWLKEHPGATLEEMPRVWLKCFNRRKNSKPLLSIGLAVYNEEKFISQTLDSLLKQDFDDFELIISDNVSTDRTFEICQEYMNKDSRIKLHRNERNIGTATLKSILKLTNGKYFMLAGGHDLWEPSFISKCVSVLNKNSDVVLCHTKCAEIDREGNFIGIIPDSIDTRNLPLEEKLPKIWLLKTGVPIYGLVRLDAFNSTNPFRGVLGTDIIVLSELSALGSIAYVDELLFYQRNHRPPESSEQSVRRTLTSMYPNQHKIKFKTAWLDLLSGHMEVLSKQNISKDSENFLLNKLMECFKQNYGELPKTEVQKLSDYYIEYFESNKNGQSNLRFIREAQVALGYINLGLLLYPKLNNLIKAYTICSSIITSTFVKRVKIAGENESEKDLTQIDQVSAFATEIGKVISEYKPTKIIETGTYHGTGTTSLIAKALKKYGLKDAKFFSIEVNPKHFVIAQQNIKNQNIQEYVTGLYGLSVPRSLLPDINQIEEYCVSNIEFDDIYVDHQENERAKLYYNETNYNDGEEDLLGKCLASFDNSPDFVLLDSGGHMGNIEFNYLIYKLKKSCIIALDDIYHIKHRKSFEQIKTDSRFKLLAHSEEKFGFCIAHFNPVKALKIDKNVKKILWVRIDSIGDNILASSMLQKIKEKFSNASITVLCQKHIAELYESSPFVDGIIGIDKNKFTKDQTYQNEFFGKLKKEEFDIVLHSIYSRELLGDLIVANTGSPIKVGFEGDLNNISKEDKVTTDTFYTHLITSRGPHKNELEKYKDFLKTLDINIDSLKPTIWLTKDDKDYAAKILNERNIDAGKYIVLFAGAQYGMRRYEHFGKALKKYLDENKFTVIALGSEDDVEINQKNLDDVNVPTLNLSGKTTIRQAAAIIEKAYFAIGTETGLAHIACAVNTPNIILLGGGHFGRFMPYSNLTSIVSLPLDCYKCNWRCKFNYAHCVKDIAPITIEQAVENFEECGPGNNPRLFIQAYFMDSQDPVKPNIDFTKVQFSFEYEEFVEIGTNLSMNKIELLIANHKYNAATDHLRKILKDVPNNLDALNNLAVTQICMDNFDEAEKLLKQVIALDERNEIANSNMRFLEEQKLRING